MKKTIVVYGSSTGTCEGIANEIASKLGTEAISVSDLSADVVAENENLILGTSTWGAGEVQDDWYDGIKVLKGADLNGKTVALINIGEIRILLKIIRHVAVFLIISHGDGYIGIDSCPVSSGDSAVLAGGFRGINFEILDIRTGKRAEIAPVLQMIHQVFLEGQ